MFPGFLKIIPHFVGLPIAPSGPQWHNLPQTPLAMVGFLSIRSPFALDFTPPPSSQARYNSFLSQMSFNSVDNLCLAFVSERRSDSSQAPERKRERRQIQTHFRCGKKSRLYFTICSQTWSQSSWTTDPISAICFFTWTWTEVERRQHVSYIYGKALPLQCRLIKCTHARHSFVIINALWWVHKRHYGTVCTWLCSLTRLLHLLGNISSFGRLVSVGPTTGRLANKNASGKWSLLCAEFGKFITSSSPPSVDINALPSLLSCTARGPSGSRSDVPGSSQAISLKMKNHESKYTSYAWWGR